MTLDASERQTRRARRNNCEDSKKMPAESRFLRARELTRPCADRTMEWDDRARKASKNLTRSNVYRLAIELKTTSRRVGRFLP